MGKKRLTEHIALTAVISVAALSIVFLPKWSDRTLGTILACLASLISLYTVANLRRIQPGDLGLTTVRKSSAIAIFTALMLFGVGIGAWKRHLGGGLVCGTIFISSLVGLSEELLYRGYLQTEAVRTLGFAKGLTAASVIFGLFHLPHNLIVNGQRGTGLIIQMCLHILFGVAMGAIYHRSKSIWTPAAAHAFVNNLALLKA